MTLLVRTVGNPTQWVATIRSRVATIDKDQPLHDVATLARLQEQSSTPRRVNMLLLGAFAALGLVLASVGIYGVVSYSVSRRTHEIGVRMALGAEREDLLQSIVGRQFIVTLIGVVLGVLGALGLTRLLASFLYGVKPSDPMTFVAVSFLISVVAALASYIPARRATKIDPMVALRYE